MSICQVPLLEGLHFLSHIMVATHSEYTVHSYHIHGDGHSHDGLDMITLSTDDQDEGHISSNISDLEKKPQFASDEVETIPQVTYTSPYTYFNYVITSQVKEIQTPPPQV